MVTFPISKINIGLCITANRPDGYHDIETVFYPVMLCDAQEIVISGNKTGKDYLTVTGLDTGSAPEDNIVIKTVRKFREKYLFPPLNIHLHKSIPVGAGLGGGSSDSACILKTVSRLFRLDISEDELKSISLEIGSDCPFFIPGVPSVAYGRGEILNPVKPVLDGYYLTLLNPGVGINTREAYQNCRPVKPADRLKDLINLPVRDWKDVITNDFEEYAFSKHSLIGQLKEDLYKAGALFSLMSGSGSSVYGIFERKPQLNENLRRYLIFEGEL